MYLNINKFNLYIIKYLPIYIQIHFQKLVLNNDFFQIFNNVNNIFMVIITFIIFFILIVSIFIINLFIIKLVIKNVINTIKYLE